MSTPARVARWPVLWFVLLMVAVLWPSRVTGPLDGAPLDRPLEAIVLGLALPWLFWLGRSVCASRAFRAAVIALLMWKGMTTYVVAQQGLCARFQSPQPLSGMAQAMRIEEPRGVLRSWDLRADLWDAEPACTAILTRPLRTIEEFPAWFVNITDQMLQRRDFTMTARGVVTDAGGQSTPVEFSLALGSAPWAFDPIVGGARVWEAPLVTTTVPSALDKAMASWAWMIAPALCAIIIGLALIAAAEPIAASVPALAWVAAGSAAAIALAVSPMTSLQRLAGVVTLGALLAPIPAARRDARAAAWIVGAPWLVFFAAVSIGSVGRFSAYSVDDWLAYQIAGYRIYMNGHWLEAGSLAFDYQPLYRWITGALHLVFGDSSVGEIYWDASCLLAGALVAFRFAAVANFKWGVAAAAMTLATLTIATPWYIIGRGLSEISAAGFAFAALACMFEPRSLRWVALAGVMASLMFYARLNHLLWAPCLVFMLLPWAGSDFRSARGAIGALPWKAAGVYLGVFGTAIVAFMTRTWYFTGHFSLFYGTALRHNDTGLRPWHVFDTEVWSKVGHSLAGLIFMNEPPRPDPRSLVLVAGMIVGLLAALQFPIARRIPVSLLLVTMGGVAGAFLAHSHGYPGRFSVHLVPLASALTAIAASTMTSGLTGSDWRVSHNNGKCTPVT